MARPPSSIVTRDVALPPYTWLMAKELSGTVWGLDLTISDERIVALRAYRSLGGRWSWTVYLYRVGATELRYGTRIGRGVAGTLSQAKPAAEAVTRDWLVDQMGFDPDDLDCPLP